MYEESDQDNKKLCSTREAKGDCNIRSLCCGFLQNKEEKHAQKTGASRVLPYQYLSS